MDLNQFRCFEPVHMPADGRNGGARPSVELAIQLALSQGDPLQKRRGYPSDLIQMMPRIQTIGSPNNVSEESQEHKQQEGCFAVTARSTGFSQLREPVNLDLHGSLEQDAFDE